MTDNRNLLYLFGRAIDRVLFADALASLEGDNVKIAIPTDEGKPFVFRCADWTFCIMPLPHGINKDCPRFGD